MTTREPPTCPSSPVVWKVLVTAVAIALATFSAVCVALNGTAVPAKTPLLSNSKICGPLPFPPATSIWSPSTSCDTSVTWIIGATPLAPASCNPAVPVAWVICTASGCGFSSTSVTRPPSAVATTSKLFAALIAAANREASVIFVVTVPPAAPLSNGTATLPLPTAAGTSLSNSNSIDKPPSVGSSWMLTTVPSFTILPSPKILMTDPVSNW